MQVQQAVAKGNRQHSVYCCCVAQSRPPLQEEVWAPRNSLLVAASGISLRDAVVMHNDVRHKLLCADGCPRTFVRFDYFVFDPGGGTI